MIIVWILSYLAVFMLGAISLLSYLLIAERRSEKKLAPRPVDTMYKNRDEGLDILSPIEGSILDYR